MSVNDGQNVDASVVNAAFVSKTASGAQTVVSPITFSDDLTASKSINVANDVTATGVTASSAMIYGVQSETSATAMSITPTAPLIDVTGASGGEITSMATGSTYNGRSVTILNRSSGDLTISAVLGDDITVSQNNAAILYHAPSASGWGGVAGGSASASESSLVSVGYTSNSGQSLTDKAFTVINFEDEDWDTTSSAVSSAASDWTFTVPTNQGGKYLLMAKVLVSQTNAWNEDESVAAQFTKNGSVIRYGNNNELHDGIGSAIDMNGSAYAVVNLAEGDAIQFEVYQDSDGTRSLSSSTTRNYISIVRLGT